MQNLNDPSESLQFQNEDDIQQEPDNTDPGMVFQGIPTPPPLPMNADMIGAIKIKDALFIGDELAAQDLEFIVNNKVTHVIN